MTRGHALAGALVGAVALSVGIVLAAPYAPTLLFLALGGLFVCLVGAFVLVGPDGDCE